MWMGFGLFKLHKMTMMLVPMGHQYICILGYMSSQKKQQNIGQYMGWFSIVYYHDNNNINKGMYNLYPVILKV